MDINKFRSLCAAFVAVIMTSSMVFGQTKEYKHAFGINQDYSVHNVQLSNKRFSSLDSSLSNSFRISYLRYLGRSWELNGGLSNGVVINHTQNEVHVDRSYFFGVDADILFKFNNGRFMSENSRIAPYLSFGYNFNMVPGFKKAGLPISSFGNEYGVGTKIRFGQWSALNLQAAMVQQLTGDFNTNLQYRLGFVQTLGKQSEKTKEPTKPGSRDYDGDGISDILDDCPTKVGLPEYKGCPTDMAKSSEKAIQDSLMAKLDKLNLEIGQMQKVIDSLEREEKIVKVDPVKPEGDQPKTIVDQEVKQKTKDEKKDPVITEVPVKTKEKEEIVVEKPEDKGDYYDHENDGGGFYIIAISTKDKNLAEKRAEELSKLYPTVRILPQPNGFYRVGIYGTKDREQADKILAYAKQNGLSYAWIAHEPAD